jgi:hypothetical protein
MRSGKASIGWRSEAGILTMPCCSVFDLPTIRSTQRYKTSGPSRTSPSKHLWNDLIQSLNFGICSRTAVGCHTTTAPAESIGDGADTRLGFQYRYSMGPAV